MNPILSPIEQTNIKSLEKEYGTNSLVSSMHIFIHLPLVNVPRNTPSILLLLGTRLCID